MLSGTSWVLEGLRTRKDLNGAHVVATEFDHDTERIRVVTPSGEHVRVVPERLRSLNDSSVNARMFIEAVRQVKSSTDEGLQTFVSNWEAGNHDGALSAAGKWGLSKLQKKASD